MIIYIFLWNLTFTVTRLGLIARSWFPLLYSINTKLSLTYKQPRGEAVSAILFDVSWKEYML